MAVKKVQRGKSALDFTKAFWKRLIEEHQESTSLALKMITASAEQNPEAIPTILQEMNETREKILGMSTAQDRLSLSKRQPAETKRIASGDLGRSLIVDEWRTSPYHSHAIIRDLIGLWDQRGTLDRSEFINRFQKILDLCHVRNSFGSFRVNQAVAKCINQFAKDNYIRLFCGEEAVSLRCIPSGETGFFQVRLATDRALTAHSGSGKVFPALRAISLVNHARPY